MGAERTSNGAKGLWMGDRVALALDKAATLQLHLLAPTITGSGPSLIQRS